MKLHLLTFILALGVFAACQNEVKEGELVENSPNDNIEDLIRNELTADGEIDTSDVAKIEFETPVYDFGEISEGELVNYTFKFKNVGTKPLIVKSAKASCGCTVPKPSSKPIAPNEVGELPITFNSSGKAGEISKTITVTSNAFPNTTRVRLVGVVRK